MLTENRRWSLIDETCRRFLENCGWPLRFVPDSDPLSIDAESAALIWRRTLTDGRGRLGELVLDLTDDHRFDAEFIQATRIAELVAGLLEETIAARVAAKSSHDDVETLARIGTSVPREPDLTSALKQLLRASIQLTQFRSAAFFLLDPGGESLVLRLKYELHRAEIPLARRVLSNETPDLTALARTPVLLRRSVHPIAATWLPTNMATAACIPVRFDRVPLGTLWMFDRRDRQPERRELHVIESIATQLGAILERAVLVRESASEKRLRRHLLAAVESQPGRDLTEPGPDCGFESAGVCRSALEIGGDLVELIAIDSMRTLIAVGDACGDGVPAAMVMANVRGALRALASAASERIAATDLLMADVNRALCAITPAHQFMSLLVGVFDATTRNFTYTNAGHPTPLHLRGELIAPLDSHGMLLGVLEDAVYERSVLDLETADLLVCFTDGVTEAMSRNQSMFRSDGVAAAVRDAVGLSAAEIVSSVWAQLATHQQGGNGTDDRSLLVLRIR